MKCAFSSLWIAMGLLGMVSGMKGAQPKDDTPVAVLDPTAEITGVYAFRSYDSDPTPRVTFILCADQLREPAQGPSWFPFDPSVLYVLNIDNDDDAVADIRFEFRFTTLPPVTDELQAYLGAGAGINAPANSPLPIAPGTPVIPPAITSFASAGFGQLQTYTVTMIVGRKKTAVEGTAPPFYAVPVNVGPRTMPNYPALFDLGIYQTTMTGVKVFAGTVDDPVFEDLGGMFDTLNFRTGAGGGVLSAMQDGATTNVASDMHSGYAVNAIAVEVPVTMLTRSGAIESSTSPLATIGVWGTTMRLGITSRPSPSRPRSSGTWKQVDRMGNALVKELMLGVKSKDRFQLDIPRKDSQFSASFMDPLLARYMNAIYGVTIPTPPRTDLMPLLTYAPPIAATGTPPGPMADMLRLNTGIAPTPVASASRLGMMGGDAAGYPNGRRLFDDVLDITMRNVGNGFGNGTTVRFGDGVNSNDEAFETTFPYIGPCPSGRQRRHLDPGETGGGATN